jgi:XTP/dITP diphosphohydrolase
VWQKVAEEVHELEDAHNHQDQEKLEEEFGDLLFALVNYSRFIHVNPETALRQSCEKFLRRFKYVEEQIIRSGGSLYDTSLETMDG